MIIKRPNSERIMKAMFPGIIVLYIAYMKIEVAPYMPKEAPMWLHIIAFAIGLFATVLFYHMIED